MWYVMSEAEYKRMFGREYVDEREIRTVKLSYAKPSVILAALGQLKSDVGKIIGKKGKTINAIRTLLMSVASRNGIRVNLEIIEDEKEEKKAE